MEVVIAVRMIWMRGVDAGVLGFYFVVQLKPGYFLSLERLFLLVLTCALSLLYGAPEPAHGLKQSQRWHRTFRGTALANRRKAYILLLTTVAGVGTAVHFAALSMDAIRSRPWRRRLDRWYFLYGVSNPPLEEVGGVRRTMGDAFRACG